MAAPVSPRFDLAGKVVLVTGAARGIGRACALACAAAGAEVAAGVRNVEAADGLIEELKELAPKSLPVKLDITDRSQIEHAVRDILKSFGRIDVLINNVGIGPENRAEDVTEADFDFTVNVNLKGTVFTTQTVGRKMIGRKSGRIMIGHKSGRIINISSHAGTVRLPRAAIYCITKAAINHLPRCLAVEWAPHTITVNSVSPTFIWPDATAPALADPEFHKRTLA